MGSIHKMERESINITEGDIVKIIFQGGVSSVVKSLADLRGVVTTGVQPTGENQNQNPLRNSGNLQIVKSVSEHVDSVTDKVNVRNISQVLQSGFKHSIRSIMIN